MPNVRLGLSELSNPAQCDDNDPRGAIGSKMPRRIAVIVTVPVPQGQKRPPSSPLQSKGLEVRVPVRVPVRVRVRHRIKG